MYRVELKAPLLWAGWTSTPTLLFLMYRVELKVLLVYALFIVVLLFLMYRVELKETVLAVLLELCPTVPNVPCGVESITYKLTQGLVEKLRS